LATETGNYDETIQKMNDDRSESEALVRELDAKITALGREVQEKMSARETLSNDHTNLANKLEALQNNLDNMISYLQTEYEITFSEAQAMNYPPVTKETRSEVAHTLQELKYKLRGIGSVDPSAIEEYKSAKVAYEEMNVQFEDLSKSREEFENTIEILEREMRAKFTTVMDDINVAFKRVFRELFGGGNAELVLTDPEDVLHCGIEINVALPGKNITNLSLLSGGEQSFISIALLFAILNVNPTPFCIFDEIEAALDEVNVAVFANYIKKYSDKTQFITITHRRGTMEAADTLYGVTMAEKGISRVLTLNVNEVEEKLGVKL
jgi:chromosome segregation protein